MEKQIKVLMMDDHQVVMDGFKLILDAEPDIRVCGFAREGAEALQRMEEIKPDILVLDLSVKKGMGGIELLKEMNSRNITLKTLVLTMMNEMEAVTEAVDAGADGYLLKNQSGRDLIQAIRSIMAGEIYLSPEVAVHLAKARQMIGTAASQPVPGIIKLSLRELEVLKLISEGLSSKLIAEKLHVSKSTVDTHRKNMMTKTGLPNMAAVLKYATDNKLI